MLTLIILLAQAVIAGVIQAFIYGKKGADSLPSNEHAWFDTERLLIWVIATYSYIDPPGWMILSVPLLFPLFYNGAYYQMRNRIDGSYVKGWRSNPSAGSTAHLNIGFKMRVILALVGVTIILILKLWK